MRLQVDGLNFNYGKKPVLHDVSFSVEPGKLLAILGPNGSGKTTLLKCLNRLLHPQSGTVRIDNTNLAHMPPNAIARSIGYVPQRIDAARLTVFDAVLLGRRPHLQWRVGKQDVSKVQSALQRLEIENLALRHTDELSGGELQKVAIARALVQEPHMLLFDEPTSALDLHAQVQMLALIRKVITGHNLTAVMTLHDINTALQHADHLLLLKHGTIRFSGNRNEITAEIIEEVYELPVTIHQIDHLPVILPALIHDP